MSNQCCPPKLLHASFNQDHSCFSICTRDGYKIYNRESMGVCYEKSDGAMGIVEMLYSSSLLAIVGAGEQPELSPRRLCLFNTVTGNAVKELNFVTAILAVCLNRKRLVVVLEEKTYIYDLNELTILDSIDTVPNPKGLCAFSPNPDVCYLALPASTKKGAVLVYNVFDLRSHCQINVHQSPLAAMALSSDGSYLATASEQGTIIRVHSVAQDAKPFSFRRGTYPASIYSLSFGPTSQVPQLLVATSSSGSVHIFTLGLMTAQRSRRSTGLLAAVIPNSVNNALEPVYHHFVLQNVLPARVKSCAIISNVDEVDRMDSSGILLDNLRARISGITFNGYFSEYSVNITPKNNSSWNLERECNLLTSPSDQVSANFVN